MSVDERPRDHRRERHRAGRGRARHRLLRLGVTISSRFGGRGTERGRTDDGGDPGSRGGDRRGSRDIRTSLLSVQPHYDYRDGKPPTLVGYELANVVEVTVRDIASVADVVDGSLRAGATSLDGLSFQVDDPAEPERIARIAAVAAARARADILAEAAGVTIAGVVDIVEGGPPPAFPRAKAERMLLAADASTPVTAGTADIEVTVTVTYRIA